MKAHRWFRQSERPASIIALLALRHHTMRVVDASLVALLPTLVACGGYARELASPSGGENWIGEFDYLLEATVLKIDVAHLHMSIDQQTAQTVAAIVSANGRTPEAEDSVTGLLMKTRDAHARLTFLMRISAQQLMASTEQTLRDLGKEGLLAAPQVEQLVRSSRQDFTFLDDTGIAAGDYIDQVLHGDSVTTRFVTVQGDQRLSSIQVGPEHRIALLGSYFAKTSDFRNGLLDQVFGVN